jgi:metallo-beta-lactamase family protein
MSQITFHGAAGMVTGPRFLLEADGTRMLIDCGMFQGVKNLWWRHWDATPLGSNKIDFGIRDQEPILHLLCSSDVGRFDGPRSANPIF